MKIVLLHEVLASDALPDATDVRVQLAAVAGELAAAGHVCECLAIDLDLGRARRRLEDLAPGLAFNLVESLGGSGRLAALAPALLESLGIAHTGAPAEAILATTDKLLAKRRLRGAGLPTPEWIEAGSRRDADRVSAPDATFIVKPVSEDASLDIEDASLVRGAEAARARVSRAPRPTFAERFVDGREFNLSLLEKDGSAELFPAAEITFEAWPRGKPRIVGYDAKWRGDSFESVHTPRRFDFGPEDSVLLSRLGVLAHACWRLFELRGYARVDFRVDAYGRPWILEINANPCLSPDAGFMAAAERAGLAARDVVERIVSAAQPQSPPRDLG